MAYSTDFKKLVLKYRRDGHTVEETCTFSGIVSSTFYEWEKEEKHGFPEKEKRSYEKKIRKEELKKAVEENPDSYLRELAEPFGCTPQAVEKALKTMKITSKKRHLPTPKSPKKNEKNS
jgi:transposase